MIVIDTQLSMIGIDHWYKSIALHHCTGSSSKLNYIGIATNSSNSLAVTCNSHMKNNNLGHHINNHNSIIQLCKHSNIARSDLEDLK